MARNRRSAEHPEPVRRDGALCAAFVNTASRRRPGLATCGELLAWGRRCGLLDDAAGEGLERAAGDDPEMAAAAVAKARRLRDLFGRIFDALAEGRPVSAGDLEELDGERLAVSSRTRLTGGSPGGYRLIWEVGDDLERVLWPVVGDMVDLLTSKHARRVRRCAGEGCDLLFVDRTPGSPRKWCDEKSCGARSRSSKYYRKAVKPRRRAVRRRLAAKKAETSRAMLAESPEDAGERSD